jgi:hypothetical protein
MSPNGFPTVNHLVKPVKRKYALIVLLNYCEISSGFLEVRDEWAISFPTFAMASGAAEDILTLTDVFGLLRVAEDGGAN